jgi:hypothetical protein
MDKDILTKNDLLVIQQEISIRLVQLGNKWDTANALTQHNIEIYVKKLDELQNKITKMEKSI